MYRREVSASSIIQSAWDVLKGNKSMLIFPLLAFISAILIIYSFTHSFSNLASFSKPSNYYEYFKLWLFYFINYFILTFFNVGLTCCALRKLQNESTTFKDGILEACKKIHLILSWSLFFASVAIIFRILEDKLSWFGKLITNIFEIALSLASYLVIPVMVAQNKGPFAALSDSAELIKDTWGNQIKGELSMGVYFFLMALPGVAIICLAIVKYSDNPSIMYLLIGISLAYLMALWIVQSALDSVYRSALYIYSITEEVPTGFSIPASIASIQKSEQSDSIDLY